jgi:hypothetical protein
MTEDIRKIAFDDVAVHRELQPRVTIDQEVVDDYAAILVDRPDALPPLDVFDVAGVPYVVDGYHRWHAHRKIGAEWLPCRVVGKGTLDEARWISTRSNQTHGLRRTNADKRAAVLSALATAIGGEQSNRVIAEHVGVSADLVAAVRAEWEASLSGRRIEVTETTPDPVPEVPKKRRGKDGKMYPTEATKAERRAKVEAFREEPIPEPVMGRPSDDLVRSYIAHMPPPEVPRPEPSPIEAAIAMARNAAELIEAPDGRIREPSRGAGFWVTKVDERMSAIVENVSGRVVVDLAVATERGVERHQIELRPDGALWLSGALKGAAETEDE